MQQVTGILDSYGPSISHRGGMRYNYISLLQDDGRMVNIPDVVAFTNVQAAMSRILRRDADGRRVTIHAEGGDFIYALEEEDGPIHSDIGTIRHLWVWSILYAFSPMLLAVALFSSGNKQLGVGGIVFFLFGLISLIKYSGSVLFFWPAIESAALERRARMPRGPAPSRVATAGG